MRFAIHDDVFVNFVADHQQVVPCPPDRVFGPLSYVERRYEADPVS